VRAEISSFPASGSPMEGIPLQAWTLPTISDSVHG
jgi:hypothetical protein